MIAPVRPALVCILCAIALAGCGNAPDRQVTLADLVTAVGGGRAPQGGADARDAATEAARALAAGDAPVILLSLPDFGIATALRRIETNGPYATFGSADRRSVTFRTGMLSATRGLGHDLMSADLAGSLALVQARRAGTARRVHRYLDGDNQVTSVEFSCRVTPGAAGRVTGGEIDAPTRVVEEVCTSPGATFRNTYQVDGSGRILKSRQFIGTRNGSMVVQVLR